MPTDNPTDQRQSAPPPVARPRPATTTTRPAISTTRKPSTSTGTKKTTGTTNPKIDWATLAAQYGFALSVLNSHPDLKKLFADSVKYGYTDDQFVAKLRATKWFQTTSETARNWSILQGADPATARQRMVARQATIAQTAASLGVSLTAAQLKDITNNTLMFGWTDLQTRQAISKDWHYGATTPTAGLAGQTIDQLRKTASDYLVPLSDNTLNQWTQNVLSGSATADDFTEYAKQQARSMFPTLSADIDRGVTVQQYADPYKQIAAQTLNINPEDVNFMDPKWRSALDNVDPTTKQRQPLSLSDWSAKIKTDSQYGYDTTAGARDQAAGLISSLNQAFGYGGG
jgi:hypothetical protein